MNGGNTNDLTNVANSLPWDELDAFAKGKYDTVSEETYRFALEPSNRELLVKSALKSLQKTDPENATQERAENLADMMVRFAKMALENKEKTTK